MKSKYIILVLFFVVCACAKKNKDEFVVSYVHASGTDIIGANNVKLHLRGVAFGNEVWTDVERPENHHTEADYARVRAMGMNTVRFYLNYKSFEDDANPYKYDKKAGWGWLDDNISWAKKNNIFLILNMHVPQGGFQSNGNGGALWNDPSNQARLKALWFEIARRYSKEQIIAGFDLLNEPVVTTSIDQWKNLAQDIIDTIRTVDKNHMIIVERVNAIDNDWSSNSDMNFFPLTDHNLAYEFHFYSPSEFTHQGASWISPAIPQGQVYPDANKLYVTGTSGFYTASFSNPNIPTGTYDWQQYVESPKFEINDPKIGLCKPTFVNRGNTGKVWVDDIIVKEYNPAGKLVDTVLNIDVTSFDGWYYWSEDESGSAGTDNTTGHSSSNSIYIEGSKGDANLSSTKYQFIPKQGYSYTISGWMKGENVTAGSQAKFRIDCEQVSPGGSVATFGKSYLEAQVDQYYNWTKINNRPLFLGEFGVIQYGFADKRGGEKWTSDMIDILKARDAHFTYHCYHEDNFGIYKGHGPIDPLNSNQLLINLFRSKLP